MITHAVRVAPAAEQDVRRAFRKDPEFPHALQAELELLAHFPHAGDPLHDLPGCRWRYVLGRQWHAAWRTVPTPEAGGRAKAIDMLAVTPAHPGSSHGLADEVRRRLHTSGKLRSRSLADAIVLLSAT